MSTHIKELGSPIPSHPTNRVKLTLVAKSSPVQQAGGAETSSPHADISAPSVTVRVDPKL